MVARTKVALAAVFGEDARQGERGVENDGSGRAQFDPPVRPLIQQAEAMHFRGSPMP